MFAQAEAYYLYGDFENANPLYLTIAAFVPDNFNVVTKSEIVILIFRTKNQKLLSFLRKLSKIPAMKQNPDQLKRKTGSARCLFLTCKSLFDP